jgi:hypothetical protein
VVLAEAGKKTISRYCPFKRPLLYSRLDLPGYECFAGVEDGLGRVVLAEAGQDCKRGLRVDTLGMLLTKRSTFIPLVKEDDK